MHPSRMPNCPLRYNVIKVVKFALEQVSKAHSTDRGIALPFLELRRYMGWVVNATPPSLYPREREGYPFCRRQDRPQGRFGRMSKILPLPGFDPRTVQTVADRYTDYAMTAIKTVLNVIHTLTE
jgi:hypothetical protein